VLVEAFVAQATIEPLDEAVLHRLAVISSPIRAISGGLYEPRFRHWNLQQPAVGLLAISPGRLDMKQFRHARNVAFRLLMIIGIIAFAAGFSPAEAKHDGWGNPGKHGWGHPGKHKGWYKHGWGNPGRHLGWYKHPWKHHGWD
jgi:hypothetical protein